MPTPELTEYNKLGGEKQVFMLSSGIDASCHYLKANVKKANVREREESEEFEVKGILVTQQSDYSSTTLSRSM